MQWLGRLFVGSSMEGLPIARQFAEELRLKLGVTLWTDPDIFPPGSFTLESIEAALARHSCALVVLSPDDITKFRGVESVTPRDNAIFELGMFVGRYGRGAAFLAVPRATALKLPSDLIGLTGVEYTVHENGQIDVADACHRILAVLERTKLKPMAQPSAFWDLLSDTIVIAFGIEPERAGPGRRRHRLSPRDFDTAVSIISFLGRRYPNKQIIPSSSAILGPHRIMRRGFDLVVVGGLITNDEYRDHRERFENTMRLRMGRLCIVAGQMVYQPQFSPPSGQLSPNYFNAQAVEDYPTEWTTVDFGLISNRVVDIYGSARRVVTIAGVKGNGTKAAAEYAMDPHDGIDAALRGPISSGDSIEVAVIADVLHDTVDRVSALRVTINGQVVARSDADVGRHCELNQSCEGCKYGLRPVAQKQQDGLKADSILATPIKAIIFDLDDTLVQTYSQLIVGLEFDAAKRMVAAGSPDSDVIALASDLLALRRESPDNIETALRQRSRAYREQKVLSARRAALQVPPLEKLTLSPEVVRLLQRLREKYELYLLTSGRMSYQRKKIKHLAIEPYFRRVAIVPSSSTRGKVETIRKLCQQHRLDATTLLIVGNRLDHEISAANALGLRSVWVRNGEGSKMTPGSSTGQPDITITDVLELSALLL